jgi:hypothetical protein
MSKSAVANQQIFSSREGDLRAVPSPNSVGASPAAPGWSALAYAWSGAGANIASIGLFLRTGLLDAPPGTYTLMVEGTPAASATAPVTWRARRN